MRPKSSFLGTSDAFSYKYAEENNLKPVRKKWSKKKKAGVAIGSALAGAYLLSALSSGDALAPISALGEGAKKAPNIIFNKAKGGRFGNAFSVGAKGVEKAVQQTSADGAKNIWDLAKKPIIKDKTSEAAKRGFSDFGTGLTVGGGILAAHLVGDKILSDRRVKKSYNSKPLTNPGIDAYHKTKNIPWNDYARDFQSVSTQKMKENRGY